MPSSAREAERSALSSIARSMQGEQLVARKLLAGQEVPSQAGILLRILSWNIFHGRDFPPDRALRTWRSRLLGLSERNATHVQVNRPLFGEFAGLIAGWDWDVAFLQEAPPRWFRPLAERSRASGALALTSRNRGAPARRLAAAFNPDLIASGEGGSNQVLVRAPGRVLEVERHVIAQRPERRTMLLRSARARRRQAPGHGEPARHGESRRSRGRAGGRARRRARGRVGGRRPARVRRRSEPPARDRARRVRGADRPARPGPPTGPKAIDHLLARGLEVVEAPKQLPPESRELTRGDGLPHPPLRPRPRLRRVRHEIVRGRGEPRWQRTEGPQVAQQRGGSEGRRRREVDAKRRKSTASQAGGAQEPTARKSTASKTHGRKAAAKKGGQARKAGSKKAQEGQRPQGLPRRADQAGDRGRRLGEVRRRVPRGPAQESDSPDGPRHAHARSHRGGAR